MHILNLEKKIMHNFLIVFDLLNSMQPTIFTKKKHSLTSKGHHEGQKLLKMGIVRFIDPIRKKYKLYKVFVVLLLN